MRQVNYEPTRPYKMQGNLLPASSMATLPYSTPLAKTAATAYLYDTQQTAKPYVLLSDEGAIWIADGGKKMNTFVKQIKHASPYELCGRMIKDGDQILVFIDEIGRFSLQIKEVSLAILGFGPGNISGPVPGVFRISESGRGLYLEIGGVLYTTPVSRVRSVLSGVHRKAPVMRYTG